MAGDASPFATRVVEYAPAPGQFVNNVLFNNPARALGPPSGGGLYAPDNSSVVSLGGFGGSITLAFDHRVENHPLNPLGLDAIVFGNAAWVGDAQTRLAECGVIEISLDVNGNGLADDPWYLISGSHIDPSNAVRQTVTWDTNTADATYPPMSAQWIPPGATGVWTTSSFVLPRDVFGRFGLRNPDYPLETEGVFGYADASPTLVLGDLDGDDVVDDPDVSPEDFYTWPDDPLTVGVDFGSGGGDAFDIAWAVDPKTGLAANLPGFDFIRITNGLHVVLGPLGESSPEIDAVADVTPDLTGDADRDRDIDLRDLSYLQLCAGTIVGSEMTCDHLLRPGEQFVGLPSGAAMIDRMTGPRS